MKVFFLATIVALVTACGHKTERVEGSRPPVKVQTLAIESTATPNLVDVIGTVRARVTATIAAKNSATVREVNVKGGSVVTAGQVLATLDDRAVRAEYDRAKADQERYRVLLDKAAATPAEVQTVQMRYRIAEAALNDCQLVAPFAGLVTGKSCDIGDLATPGKPLFTVEQPTDFRLEINVPERDATGVVVGKPIACVIEGTGEKCEGQVDEIIPLADPVTRTVLVKISLKCRQPLKSGMFGHAQLPSGERRVMLVPMSAVHERGQLTFVFIAESGQARMRLVRTGKANLDAVEILSGVQTSELLIVAGEVADGQPVTQ